MMKIVSNYSSFLLGGVNINLVDIIKAIDGKVICGKLENIKFNNIVIDSRKIEKNDIFIALKGKNYNGHDFIYDAISKKACAIFIDEELEIKSDTLVIYTKNNYETLFKIGKLYRKKYNGDVIAITGSSGKTMTKELISSILETKYKVLKSLGNQNNHIGVPMTLMKLNKNYDMAIIEMGMNHKSEIATLSYLAKPNVSVITNIGTAHIGNLKSQRNIYKAKCEIMDGMNYGDLIVNGSDKYLKKIKSKKVNVIKTNHYEIITSDLSKTIFNVIDNNKKYKFILNVPGIYLVQNCLLAIETCKKYGIKYKVMQKIIKNYKPLGGRLNLIKNKSNLIIDDSYNANYEAVIGLIKTLKPINKKKVLILGDILELGKYSKKIHKKIGKNIKSEKYDKVYYIGKYMYYAYKESKVGIWYKDANDFCNANIHFENSIIAIKGSRGMHLEKIVNYFNN